MAPDTLTELLKLPPGDRAELAMALWASLDDASRGAELALTPERLPSSIAGLLSTRPIRPAPDPGTRSRRTFANGGECPSRCPTRGRGGTLRRARLVRQSESWPGPGICQRSPRNGLGGGHEAADVSEGAWRNAPRHLEALPLWRLFSDSHRRDHHSRDHSRTPAPTPVAVPTVMLMSCGQSPPLFLHELGGCRGIQEDASRPDQFL